jgi:hypothetical protein
MLSSSMLTLRPLPRAGIHCCRKLSTAASASTSASAAPQSARVRALDRLAEGMARPMSEMEIASGSGSYLASATGERYLDFTSGIGVTNTGHCHPKVGGASACACATSFALTHTLTYGSRVHSLRAACSSAFSSVLTYVPTYQGGRRGAASDGLATPWPAVGRPLSAANPNPNPNPQASSLNPNPNPNPNPSPNPNPTPTLTLTRSASLRRSSHSPTGCSTASCPPRTTGSCSLPRAPRRWRTTQP